MNYEPQGHDLREALEAYDYSLTPNRSLARRDGGYGDTSHDHSSHHDTDREA